MNNYVNKLLVFCERIVVIVELWASAFFFSVITGLVPVIQMSEFHIMQDRIYSVYILANKRNGTLYTGVTNDLVRRVYEHREKQVDGFTKKYGVALLVWHEEFSGIELAIRREKRIKKYPRKWKLNLIEEINPDWRDLWGEIAG